MHEINSVSSVGSDKFGKKICPHNHSIPPKADFPWSFESPYILTCKALLEIMSSFPMKSNRACAVKVEIKKATKLWRKCLETPPVHFTWKGNDCLSLELTLHLLVAVIYPHSSPFLSTCEVDWIPLFNVGVIGADCMAYKPLISSSVEDITLKTQGFLH